MKAHKVLHMPIWNGRAREDLNEQRWFQRNTSACFVQCLGMFFKEQIPHVQANFEMSLVHLFGFIIKEEIS